MRSIIHCVVQHLEGIKLGSLVCRSRGCGYEWILKNVAERICSDIVVPMLTVSVVVVLVSQSRLFGKDEKHTDFLAALVKKTAFAGSPSLEWGKHQALVDGITRIWIATRNPVRMVT